MQMSDKKSGVRGGKLGRNLAKYVLQEPPPGSTGRRSRPRIFPEKIRTPFGQVCVPPARLTGPAPVERSRTGRRYTTTQGKPGLELAGRTEDSAVVFVAQDLDGAQASYLALVGKLSGSNLT